MAPEQATGRRGAVTTATDVYGLGAVLYTMLRGRPPFRGDSALDVLEQVRSREPEPPSGGNARVDRDLETICLTCLRKDPQRRYGSAEAMGDDLERWLAGEPIRARRTRAWERAVKWARRRPGVAALVSVIIMVTGLGVAGITWKWREAEWARLEAERVNRMLAASVYFNNIALAESSWREGNFGRVVRLLGGCDRKLRGWEWMYLMRLRRGEPRVLRAHKGIINNLAFDDDGRFLATAGADGIAKVWDLTELSAPPVELRGHKAPVRGVAFRPPDSRVVATVSRDGELAAWDRTTGLPLYHVHVAKEVLCLTFSSDGGLIATGDSDNRVKLWDASSGSLSGTLRGHDNVVLSVAFSRDGTRLASSGDDGTVIVWDAAGRKELLRLPRQTDTVRGLAFSPDGARLATACADGIVRVWDVATGRPALEILGFHTDSVRGVAFNPHSPRLASCSGDGTVRLWDTETGREAIVLRGHDGAVQGVAFSPDGQRLASCSGDGTVRLWDATSEGNEFEAVRTMAGDNGHDGVVNAVAFSPDNSTIASAGGDHIVLLWPARRDATPRRIPDHTSQVYSLAFSPNGETIASGGGDRLITLSKAASGQTFFTSTALDDDVWGLAYSPTAGCSPRRRGTGPSGSGRPRTASCNSCARSPRAPRRSGAWPSAPTAAAWCRAGATAPSVSGIPSTSGSPPRILGYHDEDVFGVAFSPDGKTIASTGSDRTVRLWHLSGGSAASPLRVSQGFDSVAFGPDGYLAAANGDGTVKVLDAATLEPILTLYGHTSRVLSVAFSPDGRRLVSGGFDRTVKVWDVSRWPPRRPAKAPNG
jgi:WD40 repeat protein